jgi:ABC-2 type transport system permease protein
VCFGAAGPLITRNLASIVKSSGGGSNIQVIVKHQTAVDGLDAYLKYAQQIGILVIVLIAAAALAYDSRPEAAAFLRTRATARQIILPKFIVTGGAAALAYIVGSLVAWYESDVLLGHLPVGQTLTGTAFGALFVVFVVAMVMLAASVFRGMIAVAVASLGLVIVISILGGLGVDQGWLPTHLLGSLSDLPKGAAVETYLTASAVALTATVAAIAAAPALSARREI